MRAEQISVSGLLILATVLAFELGRDPSKMEASLLRDRVPGDDVPIELDRIIDYGGQLPDHEMNIHYLPCIRLLGVPKYDI